MTYTINVGPGGESKTVTGPGNSGTESKIVHSAGTNIIFALGGGAGGRTNENAADGGSGGGGGSDWPVGTYGNPGIALTTNVPAITWGNKGGTGASSGSPCDSSSGKCYCGAGGGGNKKSGSPKGVKPVQNAQQALQQFAAVFG